MYRPRAERESAEAEDACRICGNTRGNRPFPAAEMMLGTGDRFDYQACGRCGALQIRQVPADLGRYYAPPYYSFAEPHEAPPVRRWLKRRLARHVLGGFDPLGALLDRVRGPTRDVAWARSAGAGLDAAILDVGAGAGQVLLGLRDAGFRRLLGVDPFLEHDLAYDGVRILAADLEAVDGAFDLVMFHHSFEHVVDPAATLAAARARLAPGGVLLIRTPVAAASWRTYGADWVELDAPRHLHVHTEASLRILADGAGLRIRAVDYDTDGFELWGSEQYRRGIPLRDPRSHAPGGEGRVFTADEMAAFERRAAELNRTGEAGRAAFWLVPGDAT